MTKYVYIAKANQSGTNSLARAEIQRETEKTLFTADHEDLMGTTYYLPKRILKDKPGVFTSEDEAIQYLIRKLELNIRRYKTQIAVAGGDIETLKEMKDDR